MDHTQIVTGRAGAIPSEGFYLRDNLDSTGASPAAAPFNLCPDIIQSDAAVPPSTFNSVSSWEQAYATDPIQGSANYYYVRSMNGASSKRAGAAALSWAPAQVFNFPAAWKANRMETAEKEETVVLQSDAEHIGVGAEPFVWTPPAVPAGASYFNFVSQIVDPATPIQPPQVRSWIDLASLLANPQYGFRNEAVIDCDAGAWTHRQQLAVPPGFAAAQLTFMLVASGFSGATVSLLCDAFTPSGKPIMIMPTVVAGDGIVAGAVMPMEPGYSASLAVSCRMPVGTSLKPGASLTLLIMFPLATASDLDHAMQSGAVRHIALARDIGPTPVAIASTLTFTVGAPTLAPTRH